MKPNYRNPNVSKICEACGGEFKVYPSEAELRKHCSVACFNGARPWAEVQCVVCARLFMVHNYRKDTAKCCSKGCASKYGHIVSPTNGFIGGHHTKAARLAISRAHIGNKHAAGHAPHNKGKKSPAISGPNHWNWKGGITAATVKMRNSLEYKQWRRAVFRRDFFACQMLGCLSKKKIEANHIKPVRSHPELILDAQNGITLCKVCHNNIRSKEESFVALFTLILTNYEPQRFAH